MPMKYVKATYVPRWPKGRESLRIAEAAAAIGMSSEFIRKAIKGRLKGRPPLPAYRPPGASGYGPGSGWLIRVSDLEAWWFGEERP